MANFYKDFASEKLMSFGKSFARLNGQPLDKSAIWYSYDDAAAYAATGSAYVGQPVAVIDETNLKTTLYVVGANSTLEMVGALPDGLSIELNDGKIQINGFDEAAEGSQLRKNADGELEWFVPSTDTVDGLQSAVGALQSDVKTVQDDIDALEVLVGQTSVEAQIDNAIAELDLGDTYETKGAAATTKGEIEAVIGEVAEGKTVVEMIADAQTAATYDDTELAGRMTVIENDYLKAADKTELADDIAENKSAIDTLNANSETAGSIDYKIAQAVAAIMENPDETMNSINELVTWINDHADSALELSNQVTANKNDIADLETLIGDTGVAEQIASAISDALKIDGVDKYALATDLTAAIARIAVLEGKAHEHTNKDVVDGITAEKVSAWDAAEQNAKDYADEQLAGKVDIVDGKSLISDTLIAKLEGVADGAQVNVIDTVDETQFGLENKHLTLLDIAMGKVTGLQDALDGKADKGTTLAEYGITDAYTKTETLDKIAEKITEINGGESAGEVLGQLNSYKETNDERVATAEANIAKKVDAEEGKSLVEDTLISKLEAIEAEAQVNKIEAVKVGDTLLEIVEKTVVVPVGAGLKASEEVTISEDGTLGIGQVGVSKLVNDGTDLILNGGAAV